MDIATHAMIGVIAASAVTEDQPMAAMAYAVGSVLPDLDAFGRCLGKRAFLRVHQTYSHALPFALLAGVLLWVAIPLLDWHAPWAPLALTLGMISHCLLDYTNTYGITLLAPFSRRRFCAEWVFFIDAVVIAASVLALALIWVHYRSYGSLGHTVQLAYGMTMAAYWAIKVLLRRAAMRLSLPGTLSLLPSALQPWRFLGCARQGDVVVVFQVDLLRSEVIEEARCQSLDERYDAVLRGVPEFATMRTLSPAYHAVQADSGPGGTTLVCRDLRTRNFRTRFGELELLLDHAGALKGVVFHV